MSLLKVPIYRNRALLDLAQYAPYCFCCGKLSDGTIVAAHANTQNMGKAMRLKAADIPAFVCGKCHTDLDRPAFRTHAQNEWYRAACLSMRWALENHPEVFRC